MITWKKVAKTVSTEGTTITYAGYKTDLTIESRKRHIPHTNGIGTWDHTEYTVLCNGIEMKTLMSLTDAKEYAEGLL